MLYDHSDWINLCNTRLAFDLLLEFVFRLLLSFLTFVCSLFFMFLDTSYSTRRAHRKKLNKFFLWIRIILLPNLLESHKLRCCLLDQVECPPPLGHVLRCSDVHRAHPEAGYDAFLDIGSGLVCDYDYSQTCCCCFHFDDAQVHRGAKMESL